MLGMVQVSRKRFIVSVVLLVLLWGAVAVLFFQKQALYDWWRLRSYDPPADIVALANETTMNESAKRIFYVYHPQIEERESFYTHCSDTEFTIVLGCYSAAKGIFIFRVDDERLKGVEHVTAAHEFLHAAYDRLSSSERKRIDQLTQGAYEKVTNERIKKTVDQYREKDESVVPHELHAILGTEVKDLPAELEEYYAQYFDDRAKIVAYSEQYEEEFAKRKEAAQRYEVQLKAMQPRIEEQDKKLKKDHAELMRESTSIEQERNSSANIDVGTLNTRIQNYNGRVELYNRQVSFLSKLVDSYNKMYEEYKKVVLEHQDLIKSIDSRPQHIQ